MSQNLEIEIVVKTDKADKAVSNFNNKLSKSEQPNLFKKTFGNAANQALLASKKMSFHMKHFASQTVMRMRSMGARVGQILKRIGPMLALGITAAAGAGLVALKKLGDRAATIQGVRNLFGDEDERFDRILAFQRQIGVTDDAALALTRTLARAFNPEEAEELMKILADARFNLDLDEGKLGQITEMFTKFSAKVNLGKRDLQLFEKVAGRGAPTLEQMAKATGVATVELQKMIDKGKLPNDFLIAGFKQAQLEMGNTTKTGMLATEEARKDFGKQYERMKHIFLGFLDEIAKGFLGEEATIQDFSQSFAKALDVIQVKGKQAIDTFFGALNTLKAAFKTVTNFVKENEDAFLALGIAIGIAMLPAIGSLIVAMWGYVTAATAAAAATIAATWPIIAIVAGIALLAFGLIKLCKLVRDNWDTITGFFVNIYNYVVNFFAELPAKMLQIGEDIITFFVQGINNTFNLVTNVISSLVNNITQFFAELPAKMLQIGEDIINGLKNGILNKYNAIKDTFKDVANGIKNTFKGLFGISSPSKVFVEYGGDITDGLAMGMNKGQADIDKAVANMAVDPSVFNIPAQNIDTQQLQQIRNVQENNSNTVINNNASGKFRNIGIKDDSKSVNKITAKNTEPTIANPTFNFNFDIEANGEDAQELAKQIKQEFETSFEQKMAQVFRKYSLQNA